MEVRSQILALGTDSWKPLVSNAVDFVHASNVADLAQILDQKHDFATVCLDPKQLSLILQQSHRDAQILAYSAKGIATLSTSGQILWTNSVLANWLQKDLVGRSLIESFDAAALASPFEDPIDAACMGNSVQFRVHRLNSSQPEFLDVHIHPIYNAQNEIDQLIAFCQDVSSEVEQQKKLDALHQAGRQLADLDITQLSEMSEAERVALLKYNLRSYIRDLLHYDTIEIRLLDRRTGALVPLLEDGMTPEAIQRQLFASAENNGVTGLVAFTGKSYLCPDTTLDKHYIIGASGARSSMTVPLVYNDEVVGTFNVESPRPNGFGQQDLQFTELFSKEIAAALHTLDLLSAQQNCAVSQSIDLVCREIALPVDDILASAATILKSGLVQEESLISHLRRIVSNARNVKDSVRRVGSQVLPEMPTNSRSPLAGKRVLVVEQVDRMRRSAHLTLERLGAEAETVETAAEGLAMVADSTYDAVFLEVRPKDLGGYDSYCRFLKLRPGIRIAMTTGFGYDAAHSLVKAKADGLKHVLFKPFKEEQVVKAVLATIGTPVGSC